MNPPRNKIIPLEVANVIIDKYDTTLNLLEESTEIYGKALDGKGSIEYKNGNRYEGEFTNGMLHGNGTFYWKNGVKYTGSFLFNKIAGEGRYEWPDGSWYEGEVRLGLRHGNGKYVTADESVYQGEWKDGLKHGKGILGFKSGTVYEGDFENGMKHGYGKISYPSGNYYEGGWANDKKEGHGTMFWVDAEEKYTGSWKDNRQDGWGEHLWLEEKGDGKFLRNRYEGEWKNGLRNGIGVFYYSNGSKYEGEWIDNLKEGFAVFTHEDGKVFKGLYRNDKMVVNKELPKSGELDPMNTTHSPGAEDESVMKKQATTLSVINENQPMAKRTTSKRQTNTFPDKSAELKEPNLKTNEIQANPYDTLLDISDLFAEEDVDRVFAEILEVKNLLLRYHGNMKLWYRNYSLKQTAHGEETFALTTKMFWKMLRDTKVLSPKVTIAAFNRLFIQGAKNNFYLHTTHHTLKKSLFLAKCEYLESLSEVERENSEIQIEDISEEELFHNDQKSDVHDENKILFFRQFVDALVRVAYLKHGDFPSFAKKIEEVLLQIQNSLEKKKKAKYQIDEENTLIRVRASTEGLRERLKNLFIQFPAKGQTFEFETIDNTMTVKKILDLFEICGIIQDEEDKERVIHLCERAYDLNDCYVIMEPVKEKNSPASQNNLQDRMRKLGDLLTSEVVFLEFYDIFLLSLFSKDGLLIKEDEIRKRSNAYLKALEDYAKENQAETKDIFERGSEISWPYSQKDYMFEHLTVEKEKREREIALLRQKKLEREMEERESKAMEKEDKDINDDYLRPLTKQTQVESDGFIESYNEF